MTLRSIAPLFAAAVFASAATAGEPAAPEAPALPADCTAPQVLAAARAMLPLRPVVLEGAIVLRNRRGIPQAEYSYTLETHRDEKPARVEVDIRSRDGSRPVLKATVKRGVFGDASIETVAPDGTRAAPDFSAPVLGTDVTWLDLTLDFLWWPGAEYEAERELESVHGQKCVVILVRPPKAMEGMTAVRLWADRRTGCLMQAEQLGPDGGAVRRLWGTRIRKFDGRWFVSAIETEAKGAGHRTKITVEKLR